MATEILKLESEVKKILTLIDQGNNFLLSGGAGSGKTYSLVSIIKQILLNNSLHKLACITYTNAAVKEIKSRIDHDNLFVSTIHDFLWDNIKSFQRELNNALVQLIKDDKIKVNDDNFDAASLSGKVIEYKEYKRIREGTISHDEVLILAHYMFETYAKLSDIVKDKYQFIFLDEYQDTHPLVIEILLKFLKNNGSRKNIIGLFGDAMQSIYDDGVGSINENDPNHMTHYLKNKAIIEVEKKQNRRNPRYVYELANKLRRDGLIQEHSADNNAPNMQGGEVKAGTMKFYYSPIQKNKDQTDTNITNDTAYDYLEKLKKLLGWNFDDSEQTKELNLTHNLIAKKAGFADLMEIYDGDKILDYKDRIKKFCKEQKLEISSLGKTFGGVINKLKKNIQITKKLNLPPSKKLI